MVTIMVHHIHGDGFPEIAGSVSLEKFKKVIDKYPKARFTFDDGLLCHELAVNVLDKKGIQGWFFVNNVNEMEQDRVTRQSPDFYWWFMDVYLGKFPYPNMPDSFLAEFSFYSKVEREYRYIRDILNPDGHDFIMKPFRKPIEFIGLDKLRHHKIGLHTYSHPRRLSMLSVGEQYLQWQLNAEYVGETDCAQHYVLAHLHFAILGW